MLTSSRPHASHFVQWAADKPEVVVLTADLTYSCEMGEFKARFPDRYLSMGMAEQNMLGVAAGLAREGYTPWVHTFAVFITRRAFDQVAMSIAYPNLPVRLVGFLPGITTPGGVTHQAVDDLALMRVIPNMTVLECGDATEVEGVLDVAHAVSGPVYIRMLRGIVPRLFPADQPPQLGRVRLIRQGRTLALISSGICTEEAIRACLALDRVGVDVHHLHVSSLKPFDYQSVIQAAASVTHGVISIENHSVVGGLGSTIAEVFADHGSNRRLIRLGLQDTYAHGASCRYLMREYGLDARAVVQAAETLLGRDLGIADGELSAIEIPSLERTSHQVEAL